MGLLYAAGRPLHDADQDAIEARRIAARCQRNAASCELLADEYPRDEVRRALALDGPGDTVATRIVHTTAA